MCINNSETVLYTLAQEIKDLVSGYTIDHVHGRLLPHLSIVLNI